MAGDLIAHVWPLVIFIGLMAAVQGMLRACDKQFLCAVYSFVFLFIVGIPIGVLFAMTFNVGLAGLWYGNMVGLALFALAGGYWYWRVSWSGMALEVLRRADEHFGDDAETEVESSNTSSGLV